MQKVDKEKICEIINKWLNITEWIKEKIVKNKEITDFFSNSIQDIYNLLEKDSFEYKKFDSWKVTNYHTIYRLPREENNYANYESKSINDLLNILKEITLYNEIEWEKHFNVWDNYQILRYFTKLFQNSKNEILIVDNYMDSNIFDFIEEIDNSIKIMILTSKEGVKPNFKNLYFAYQWLNLESKLYDIKNHDRYIIIDKKVIYLVWTSFNCFWKSDFTIKKLDDKEKIEYLYDLWNKSELL